MREQLNNNPILQLAVIGVLLLGGVFFFVSTTGGGGEEGGSEVTATVNGATAAGATPGEAVEGAVGSLETGAAPAAAPPSALSAAPPPGPVVDSWEAGDTVVLLFVRDGGIDDRLLTSATKGVAGLPRAKVFVVPAGKISRYAAITEGLGLERVPALVVLTPKRLDGETPTASVHYGFQSPASVAQAVVDAGYEGPTLDYHP